MNTIYKKKIIGTTLVGIFLFSIIMTGSLFAYAKNSNGDNRAYKFNGTVIDINESELEVDTNDEGDITFELTNKTTFTKGLDWNDINEDDIVSVIAKKTATGDYVAKVVKVTSGTGYGNCSHNGNCNNNCF